MRKQRRWKKTVAFFCVGTILLMGGCGKSSGEIKGTGNGAKGRYVESSVTVDGLTEAQYMNQLDDGSYVIFNKDAKEIEVSNDEGETWKAVKEPAIEETLVEGTHFSGFCAYGDGTILILYMDKEDTAPKDANGNIIVENHYIQIAADQTVKKGNLKCDDDVGYIDEFLEVNGRIFTSSPSGSIYEVDIANETLNKLFDTNVEGRFEICDCGTILAVINNNVPYFYNLETNQLMDTDMTLADFIRDNKRMYESTLTAADEKNTIYFACSKGLYRHTIGGTVIEQVIDGSLSSMGSPLKHVTSVQQKPDGNFIMLYSDGTVCHYTYDDTISSVPEVELKVYSLYDSSMIRAAISSFQSNHLDIYINYEVGISGDSSMTETDAIKNLNTDMMAGDGPDIILLDGLPMKSYMEKGVLADLSKFITKTEKKDTYFENILSAYETDGKTYAIPVRYNIPILAGPNELTTKNNTISDFEKALDQTNYDCDTLLGTYNSNEILEMFYQTVSPELMKKDGSLDKKKLTDFLTEVSKINDIENRKITDSMRKEYNDTMAMAYNDEGGMPESDRISDSLNADYQLLRTAARKQAVIAGYMNGEQRDAAFISTAMAQLGNSSINSLPGLNQSGEVFLPVGIVGISSKTKHMDEAKTFLTALLSEEVQQISGLEGLPVNVNAFENTYDAMENLDLLTAAYFGNGRDAELHVTGISKEDRAAIRSIADQLSVPAVTDNTIHDVIIENGAKALDGDISMEEAVNTIMKKVGIYAQE